MFAIFPGGDLLLRGLARSISRCSRAEVAMAKGVLVVQTAPISPERTQEYHDWYNETHLPEVLSIPGFVQARRFRLVDATGATAAGSSASLMENLAIYEVEAD